MEKYIVTINKLGTEIWRNEKGQYHRENNKPAVIYKNGRIEYWKNGKLYERGDNLPTIIHANGDFEYWKNNKIHRDNDEPAFVSKDMMIYYTHGKINRKEKPAIIHSDGTLEYWKNDIKRSIVSNHLTIYFDKHSLIHSKKNKTNGSRSAAIIHSNGLKEYFKHGKFLYARY